MSTSHLEDIKVDLSST